MGWLDWKKRRAVGRKGEGEIRKSHGEEVEEGEVRITVCECGASQQTWPSGSTCRALPLYGAACPVLAAYSTADYDTRAWAMPERVVSFAHSDTATPTRISGEFLHRRQSPHEAAPDVGPKSRPAY